LIINRQEERQMNKSSIKVRRGWLWRKYVVAARGIRMGIVG
jgi:hypothetical protein